MMTLRKTADWTVKNDDEQITVGVLLVPDRIDSQGDWFEDNTIRRIAHGYIRRLEAVCFAHGFRQELDISCEAFHNTLILG
jgi:hypothetical protein